MSSDAGQHVVDALSNPVVVKAVSTITAGTGAATYLEYLPANIGWIASTIGLVMTLFMGILAWRRDQRDNRAFKQAERERHLRIEKLERELT